jgi:catechol 1,2-dioxygenase
VTRPSRREFLAGTVAGAAALWLPGCQPATAGGGPDQAGPDLLPTPQCEETEDNLLGPYYRDNAPFRTTIADASEGEALTVSGVVRGAGLACVALDGALIDVWQANASAIYDANSPEFHWRGRMKTDAAGRYTLHSILPGRYLNNGTYRPRHIHFQVSQPGYVKLTTQLYFDGDPFNPTDPFIKASLIRPMTKAGATWQLTFDIALASL